MNNQLDQCYSVFNLKQENISKELLRKCYFRESLKYHPDKNDSPNAKEKFHEIHECYEVLMKYHGYMDDDSYDLGCDEEKTEEVPIPEYANMIYSFLEPMIQTELFQDIHSKILVKLVETLKHKCEDKAMQMLENLNIKKCKSIYLLINNNKDILNIPSSFVEKVKDLYESKMEKDQIIRIFPSLQDLMIDNLYKLNENNKEYLIPLWHHELVYDNNGAELYVQIIPKLEENITIDENNNLHIDQSYSLYELWKMENICIKIANKLLTIEKSSLKLIPKQVITLPNIGISKINCNNIYDNSKRGSIHIHIEIVD